MFLPRLGQLGNDRSARRQPSDDLALVNYPRGLVNCSSRLGELCKRIKSGLSMQNQRVAGLIPKTLRAENYPKISKNRNSLGPTLMGAIDRSRLSTSQRVDGTARRHTPPR